MLRNWLIKWGQGFSHMGWCHIKCYLICHCDYHSRNWPLEGDRVLSNHCDFSSSCLPEASSTSLQVVLCFGQQSICLVVSLNKESFEKGLTSDWSQLFWSMKVKAPLFFQYENSPYTSLRNSGWWKLKRKWMRILPRRDGGPKGAALLGVHLEVFFTLYVSDPSPTTLSFRDLCWAKHAGALTGITQNSKFTFMTIVQHFKLFLITRECFIFQWGALEIGHICQYRYMVGLRPYRPVRRGLHEYIVAINSQHHIVIVEVFLIEICPFKQRKVTAIRFSGVSGKCQHHHTGAWACGGVWGEADLDFLFRSANVQMLVSPLISFSKYSLPFLLRFSASPKRKFSEYQ